MPSKYTQPTKVIKDAIKKHAGLSDFDDYAIDEEVNAIMKALSKNGYKVVRKVN